MLPVLRGKKPGEVAGMAAMAMGVGYLIAAGGPALVGAVFDLTALDVAADRADGLHARAVARRALLVKGSPT